MEFTVLRVIDILEEPRRRNLEMLWPNARREVLPIHISLLNKFFAGKEQHTLGELKRLFEAHGFEPQLIHSLIFRKAVWTDLENNPLMERTILRRNLQYKFVPDFKGFADEPEIPF